MREFSVDGSDSKVPPDGAVAELHQEVVQHVAVVLVDAAYLTEAQNGLLLQVKDWVDEGCQLLTEVDGLIDGYLSSIFLVLSEYAFHALDVS